MFGLIYEGYAFRLMLEQVVKKYDNKSLLDLPGAGIKEMVSIYSVYMGLAGYKDTIVNGENAFLEVWN